MRDITLDDSLMAYLATGGPVADMDLLARCSMAARFLWLDEAGRLWTRGRGGVWVEIPPIGARLELV